MSGDDVALLQKRLKEFGHLAGAVDGQFDRLTVGAVAGYQRAHGLAADGVVGPDTWAALGLDSVEPAPQKPPDRYAEGAAISLHIGVNRVDPARYGGWSGALAGCENDARTMTAVAAAEGFRTTQLFTSQATTANVLEAVRAAAEKLTAGGFFLLTYAGHGGQVPDRNAEPDETDQQDETWVLYDRQLLDDEIERALAAFQAGVNIVLLSDSCHSGTVYRRMDDPAQLRFAELKRTFYADLGVPRAGPDDEWPPASFPRPVAAARGALSRWEQQQRQLIAGVLDDGVSRIDVGPEGAHGARYPGQGSVRPVGLLERAARGAGEVTSAVLTRELPIGHNVVANQEQAAVLDAVKADCRSRGPIRANGVLISGCEDAQLSQEVGGHGVFTTTLHHVWSDGTFTGPYATFHRQVASRMGPTQCPVLTPFGQAPGTLLARTPFDR